MKTISSAMNTHLQGEVTTLATCWTLKRRDGRLFRFTDHVNDIVFEGATYLADFGYDRTAIANSVDLSVDSLEVAGVFDPATIENSDLRKGLFDFSEIELFLVNYNDLTMGNIKLRSGSIGEVRSKTTGQFTAELRGKAQRLQQSIGVLYQATCRDKLGGKVCLFPLQPSVILRSTNYLLGEFVRVYTANPSAVTLPIPLVNGSFDSLTSWVTDAGDPAIVTAVNGNAPFEGSGFLHGSLTTSPTGYSISQDVDITAIGGFSQVDLDAGNYLFQASIRYIKTLVRSRDVGRIRVEALNAAGVTIQELWNSKFEVIEEDIWTLLTVSDKILAPGTTTLRFIVEGGSYGATNVTQIGFDDLQAEIIDNVGVSGAQEFYENRIYECTTAGQTGASEPSPGFDTTINNTTTDGSAVFTARDAFTRHAVVASVTDKRIFTVTMVSHGSSADDWFNFGEVIWETGLNAGLSMEIKNWVESSKSVTLFLQMQETIQVGDKLKMVTGCDQKRASCRDKFRIANAINLSLGNVVNYDGEPDIPGPDFMLITPDAK